MSKRIPWNKGLKIGPNLEHSKIMKGKPSGFLGKHHRENTINKIKETHKGKHYSLKTEFRKGCISLRKGIKLLDETKRKISFSMKGKLKGIKLSEEHRKKIGLALTGRKLSNEHRKNISLGKKGKVAWSKGKKLSHLTGKNASNWKGGITPLYTSIRESLEYKLWRNAVYQKDNYTCCECEDNKGSNLEAHHIKPFAFILKEFLQEYNQFSLFDDKEILIRLAITYKPFWDIANGKTLCKDCHKKQLLPQERNLQCQ